MPACDRLLWNVSSIDRLGVQHQAQALAITDGRITWSGSIQHIPEALRRSAKIVEDCAGDLITPGLIDCHTHLVYAGNRADEFQQRLQGVSYVDIANRGGGILSTVRQTRAASLEELLEQSRPRLLALRAEGVTTVEIKSGYGLDLPNELKMLRVARELGRQTGLRVKTTFLGAHAVPPEYQGLAQDYVDYLCAHVLPCVASEGLADAVDVFCETIAFSLPETEQLFLKAQALGLPVKCHAEQLSNVGASKLAARFLALSCDHLEYLDEAGAMAMAQAGTVAVLLPGAYYFLKETQKPPVALLREAGVGMAVATDCNPGSSPTTSIQLMMSMACQFFSLTVPEVWSAVTHQAAKALGIAHEVGTLEAGMMADLVRWGIKDSAMMCYHFGHPLPCVTMVAGLWQNHEEKRNG